MGSYTNSLNFFSLNHLSNQFCQTLLLPNITAIQYVLLKLIVLGITLHSGLRLLQYIDYCITILYHGTWSIA